MRKFFTIFFISILFLLSITVFFLSTTGYETKRFNNLINNKLQNIDEKISLELNEIKKCLDYGDRGAVIQHLCGLNRNPSKKETLVAQLQGLHKHVEEKKLEEAKEGTKRCH